MLQISATEIYDSLSVENPWWEGNSKQPFIKHARAYLPAFQELVLQEDIVRTVILLGPRRVGKTVMVLQTIAALLKGGVNAEDVLYAGLDRPLYNGISLEKIVSMHLEQTNQKSNHRRYFFLDEIQYIRNWEQELKNLTDLYPYIRFVASGSAAAALRIKSRESGAGRFTDFLLPPLTFDEFLTFQTSRDEALERLRSYADGGFRKNKSLEQSDIYYLNGLFERYLTYGGYPEAVFSKRVQDNLDRFVREDIVEKVLLRDLPSLYGISDTRELNSLFTTLCYNTAHEVSLEKLSQSSAVAKNTIKRYLEYLEAAFLVRSVLRIDQNARRFQRQTAFKVYLANPSLRAALFRPMSQDDELFGHLAETAVFSQWFHSPSQTPLHYARWSEGEVDLVNLDEKQNPSWFVEIKWSDRSLDRGIDASTRAFIRRHEKSLDAGVVTSRTRFGVREVAGLEVRIIPTAIYCWQVGRNSVAARADDQLALPFHDLA